ncbi:hypothetical protein [Brucella gallinifaecis]|uniref:hypothetical protein n=1 Tax=Brucella gallinifaecis TaxID=215590 RepID=UPI00235F7FBB|nr:hypothetical protein [Brucella gallinifaecis]
MPVSLDEKTGGIIAVLPIHFDLPSHNIPLSTFVQTAEQTAVIVAALNRELFAGKLKYEILVLPPQHGSFKSKIGILLAVGGILWAGLESSVGQAFVKGLTGHEPAYWAEIAGKKTKEYLEAGSEDSAPEKAKGSEIAEPEKIKCIATGEILIEATKSFLQSEVLDLEVLGVTTSQFRDAYEARNEFYQACLNTRHLRAVGFEDAPVFPVSRRDFTQLQIVLPPREDDTDETWLTAIADLKVTSPNWDREDRHRNWKGRDVNGRDRFFRIDDEHFWQLVKAERLNTHIIDTIKVHWAFRGSPAAPKNIRVLKVLEFNGERLAEPLDDNALDAILGNYFVIETDQLDLFGAAEDKT